MHVVFDATGHIRHAGPAALKLSPDRDLIGMRLMEFVELRRPKASSSASSLLRHAGAKLHFALRNPSRTELKGVIVPLPDEAIAGMKGGAVLNLSFGISVVEAVRDYALTSSDFAVTDLAIEMLYLVEAKSAVMEELRRLNLRLNGARAQAEQQAYTDTLTGLGNRRAMDQMLMQLAATGRRFALMHVDLDHFKQANDTFGHAAGDHVLQTTARRLLGGTRGNDAVIRQGGDEFLLILPDLTEPGLISDMAARLLAKLEEPILFGEEKVHISASIGISISPIKGDVDAERIMEEADIALYAVKASGRSGYKLYSAEMGRMGSVRAATVAIT